MLSLSCQPNNRLPPLVRQCSPLSDNLHFALIPSHFLLIILLTTQTIGVPTKWSRMYTVNLELDHIPRVSDTECVCYVICNLSRPSVTYALAISTKNCVRYLCPLGFTLYTQTSDHPVSLALGKEQTRISLSLELINGACPPLHPGFEPGPFRMKGVCFTTVLPSLSPRDSNHREQIINVSDIYDNKQER